MVIWNRVTPVLLMGFSLLQLGCSTPALLDRPGTEQLEQGHQRALELAEVRTAEVIIYAGDLIRVQRDVLPSMENHDNEYRVRADGQVSLPEIGFLHVAGRTPGEVSALVTAAYARIYRQPETTVDIVETPESSIYVGGEVRAPGAFPLTGVVTLEQGVLRAGGVSASADSENIALLRLGPDSQYQLYFFDLSSILTLHQRRAIRLQHGDIIYVPKSGVGRTVEAIDMYFTRLIPISKSVGVGFNYELNPEDRR